MVAVAAEQGDVEGAGLHGVAVLAVVVGDRHLARLGVAGRPLPPLVGQLTGLVVDRGQLPDRGGGASEAGPGVARDAEDDVVVAAVDLADALIQRQGGGGVEPGRGAVAPPGVGVAVEVAAQGDHDPGVAGGDRRGMVGGPEDAAVAQRRGRHARAAGVVAGVGQAVGQVVEVADLDRRAEAGPAVGRLHEQDLVAVVVARHGVVEVLEDHIEVAVGGGEGLRELVGVTGSGRGAAEVDRAQRRRGAADAGDQVPGRAVVVGPGEADRVGGEVGVVLGPADMDPVPEPAGLGGVDGHIRLVEQADRPGAVILLDDPGREVPRRPAGSRSGQPGGGGSSWG
jgi:hypothetical protein